MLKVEEGGIKMEMGKYFLAFAFFSFIGWLWECVYYTIQQRKRVNSGFLSTCFCPIYGIGGMLGLLVLGRVENVWILFFAGMILTGALEYFVSWMLEKLFHRRWWDYTGWPMNINGRIFLFGVILFGLGIVALVKFVAPFTFGVIDSMDPAAVQILSVLIAAVMLIDTIRSARHIDSEKLWYVEKQEEFIENSRLWNRIKQTFRR